MYACVTFPISPKKFQIFCFTLDIERKKNKIWPNNWIRTSVCVRVCCPMPLHSAETFECDNVGQRFQWQANGEAGAIHHVRIETPNLFFINIIYSHSFITTYTLYGLCVLVFISLFIYSIFTQRSPITRLSLVRLPFPSVRFYFEICISLYFEMACRIAVSTTQMQLGCLHIRRGLSRRGINRAN